MIACYHVCALLMVALPSPSPPSRRNNFARAPNAGRTCETLHTVALARRSNHSHSPARSLARRLHQGRTRRVKDRDLERSGNSKLRTRRRRPRGAATNHMRIITRKERTLGGIPRNTPASSPCAISNRDTLGTRRGCGKGTDSGQPSEGSQYVLLCFVHRLRA